MLVFEAITQKSRDLTNHLLDHSKTYPKFSFKEAETVKESSQAQNLRYKIFKKDNVQIIFLSILKQLKKSPISLYRLLL